MDDLRDGIDSFIVHAVSLDAIEAQALCGEREWLFGSDNPTVVSCPHCRNLLRVSARESQELKRAA